jgi:two-component system cell cycle sensor histidine kinase/response regulator CckA
MHCPAERRAPAPPADSESDLPTRGKILVVDDEEAVRTMVKRTLESRGCDVLAAGSAFEALTLLNRNAGGISLVILDLSMPGMSGREVLPGLLAIDPRLDVLVSSGYAEAETLRLFQGMRVAGFIQKPYTVRRLLEKIKEIADRQAR